MLDRLRPKALSPPEGPVRISGERALAPLAPIPLRSLSSSDLLATPLPPATPDRDATSPLAAALSRTETFRRTMLGLHDALDAAAAADDAASAPAPSPVAERPRAPSGDALDAELRRDETRRSPDTVLEVAAVFRAAPSTSALFKERLAALEREHAAAEKKNTTTANANPEAATTTITTTPAALRSPRFLPLGAGPDPAYRDPAFGGAASSSDFGGETAAAFAFRPEARAVLARARLGSDPVAIWPGCSFALGLRHAGGNAYALRLENLDRRPCDAWGKVVLTRPLLDGQRVVVFGTRAAKGEFPTETGRWHISRKIRLSPRDVHDSTHGDGSLLLQGRLTFHAPVAPSTHSYTYHR